MAKRDRSHPRWFWVRWLVVLLIVVSVAACFYYNLPYKWAALIVGPVFLLLMFARRLAQYIIRLQTTKARVRELSSNDDDTDYSDEDEALALSRPLKLIDLQQQEGSLGFVAHVLGVTLPATSPKEQAARVVVARICTPLAFWAPTEGSRFYTDAFDVLPNEVADYVLAEKAQPNQAMSSAVAAFFEAQQTPQPNRGPDQPSPGPEKPPFTLGEDGSITVNDTLYHPNYRGQPQIRVCTYAGDGGVGKTVIAAMLAAEINEKRKVAVLLLDANSGGSLIGRYPVKGVTHNKTIIDLAEACLSGEVSSISDFEQYGRWSDGGVLVVQRHVHGQSALTDQGLRAILKASEGAFKYVIIDGGNNLSDATKPAIFESDVVVLVADPASNDQQNGLTNVADLMIDVPGKPIMVVFNQVKNATPGQIGRATKAFTAPPRFDKDDKIGITFRLHNPMGLHIRVVPNMPPFHDRGAVWAANVPAAATPALLEMAATAVDLAVGRRDTTPRLINQLLLEVGTKPDASEQENQDQTNESVDASDSIPPSDQTPVSPAPQEVGPVTDSVNRTEPVKPDGRNDSRQQTPPTPPRVAPAQSYGASPYVGNGYHAASAAAPVPTRPPVPVNGNGYRPQVPINGNNGHAQAPVVPHDQYVPQYGAGNDPGPITEEFAAITALPAYREEIEQALREPRHAHPAEDIVDVEPAPVQTNTPPAEPVATFTAPVEPEEPKTLREHVVDELTAQEGRQPLMASVKKFEAELIILNQEAGVLGDEPDPETLYTKSQLRWPAHTR